MDFDVESDNDMKMKWYDFMQCPLIPHPNKRGLKGEDYEKVRIPTLKVLSLYVMKLMTWILF